MYAQVHQSFVRDECGQSYCCRFREVFLQLVLICVLEALDKILLGNINLLYQ